MYRSVFPLLSLAALVSLVFLSGCAGPAPYRYHYVRGRTAVIRGGYAVAPTHAPSVVRAAIDAGNRIAGLPYRYGGGHTLGMSNAYDCSGATSFVLRGAGRLHSPCPAIAFRHYGASGKGRWISIYARRDHVFLVVAGLRFDTGWGRGAEGPKWTTLSRPATGCVIRHPEGL